MLKRLCLSAMMWGLAISPLAHADADLARDWSTAAGQLYGETVTLLDGETIPARFESDVARFSVTSARLARWIETEGGPSDLACIFRGMADEAEQQLDVLEAGETRPHAALMRLAVLFHDAEGIALAAVSATERGEIAQPAQAKSCAANPTAVRQYLIEQP